MKIKGLNNVMKNLNNEIRAIEGRSTMGLLESAALIRNDMEKTPPLVPVDTGALRASWFATPLAGQKFPIVLAGFKVNYAAYVHEMVGANFKRSGAGAKFLEAAVKRNSQEIVKIVQKNAKVR